MAHKRQAIHLPARKFPLRDDAEMLVMEGEKLLNKAAVNVYRAKMEVWNQKQQMSKRRPILKGSP